MMMEPDDLQLKYKPSKVCGICGDKALGYNFNAVTCEACKAFFRRNALRTKHSQQDFKCPFDGNCKIDLVTRRFCQKCRLKKCFDIGMKKEWILSDDEKKVKRDKIIENRRKKETGAPYGNLDTYSNSSVDEMTYSPEMKPSMKSMNSDLLNSNYSLSVSEGKGFFNSLYLLEQYQNQYQNFMSGKSPKESPTMAGPYSSGPIPKVPNHHSAGDVSPHGPSHNSSKSVDAVLRSPPPMAATSNSNPLLNGYQGIYPKGLEPGKHYGDYGYGPFSQHQQPPHHPHQHHSQHHPPQHRVPAMPGSSSSTHNHRPPHPPLPPPPSNGHLNGGGGGGGHHLMPTMPPAALEKPDTPIHALPSPFYQKCADSAELNRGHMSEISSNSSDSSYHFNPYYQEKSLAARSRSESQITSPEQQQLPNGKSPQVHLNGSTDSGFTKENDSNEYLSSDEENLSARGGGGGAPYAKDLNEDSNSVSNCDLRRPILATPAALPSSSGKNVHMEKLMGDSGSNSTGSSAANANTSRNSSSGTGEHTTSSSSSSSSGSNCNISSSIRTGSGGASVVKPSLSVYNFIEELRMQELSSACDLLRPWTRYRKVVHEMSQVNQMYEAVEQIINKVIEMSRMVTTFKDLCEMEQMALLKGAVTEMIILRSVLNYMPDKDSWVFNLLSETDEGQFLKYSTYEKLICKGYYVEVKQFMLSFSQDWKNDKTLFDLLTVIILFTPNRPNLKHKEIIKLEYLTWRHLLQKHLHAKVGSKELSQTYFSNLMDLLERLHAINEKVNKMYTFKVIESFKL